MGLDAQYWTERYKNNESGWDLGAISPPLKAYIDQLKNKDLEILIPGAGNAYEAEYLLKQGFTNVTVCDLSSVPLENLHKRVGENKALNLLNGDFFRLEQRFDLILEQTFFCALNPELRQGYFLKMRELLNPGGKLVGVLFNDALNRDRPPFGGYKEEYLTYIPAGLQVKVFDKCHNSIAPRADRELFMILQKD